MKRNRAKLKLDIVVTGREGRTVETRTIESDILLRNFLCHVKSNIFYTSTTAPDGAVDVTNVPRNIASGSGISPRMMLGSGTTAETSGDYRIQTPLYTAPDACSTGTVLPGSGNQVVLAVVGGHTFAAATMVYEAGICLCYGSTTVYLTANNFQLSRNVFAGVSVPAGGTFTATYTLTIN